MAAGGAIGAAIGAATETKGGLLGGLALGVLVGALVDGGRPEMKRIMALQFDHSANDWRIYDGPLLPWMKQQVANH